MLLQLDNDHTNICRPSHWLGSFQLTRRNNLIGRLVGSQEHNREEVQVSTNRQEHAMRTQARCFLGIEIPQAQFVMIYAKSEATK